MLIYPHKFVICGDAFDFMSSDVQHVRNWVLVVMIMKFINKVIKIL